MGPNPSLNPNRAVPSLAKAAKQGVRSAARLWLENAVVRHLVLNGPAGLMPPGSLTSLSDFRATMQHGMMSAGAAPSLAGTLAAPVSDAWNAWFEGATCQLHYPSFAAVPAPMAPPTPCLPKPLREVVSTNAHRMKADSLERDLRSALGSTIKSPGVDPAVKDFSVWLAERFEDWQQSATLQNVLAKGPVPTFAPPYVPTGPVVGGDTIVIPGHLMTNLGAFDLGI